MIYATETNGAHHYTWQKAVALLLTNSASIGTSSSTRVIPAPSRLYEYYLQRFQLRGIDARPRYTARRSGGAARIPQVRGW
jgi:hypothetical protein